MQCTNTAKQKNARLDDITERRDDQFYKAKYNERTPHHDSDSAAERIVWRGHRHPHIYKTNSTLSPNLTTVTSTASSGAETYPTIPFVNTTSLSSTSLADPTASDCSFSVITITTTLDYVQTVTASFSSNSSAPPPKTEAHYVNTTTSWFNWNTSVTSTVSSYLTGSAYPTITEDPCPFENGTHHYATGNATITATSSTATVSDPPCDDETSTSAGASASPTMTEPCDDESSSSSSAAATTTEPCDDDASTTTASASATTEPCDDDLSSTSSDPDGTSTVRVTLSQVVTVVPVHAVTTSSSAGASGRDAVTTTFTPTSTTTTCVIDTLITPVTQAVLTSTVTTTVTPTKTVCATDAPTGTPKKTNSHCGVHGKAVGDFFIGRFVENAANLPVTLKGCYQFCEVSCLSAIRCISFPPLLTCIPLSQSVWGDTHGCLSFDYYLNSLGAPRCDLYGSTVAYALDDIDNNQPNWWFDRECGDPTAPEWAGLNIEASLKAELKALGTSVKAAVNVEIGI